MEQQFFDRENVAEVNEMQLVSHERLYQIEPTQPQELETINEIQTETENEQQLRKPIVNECIAETMLQGSLQVVHDVVSIILQFANFLSPFYCVIASHD